MTVRIVHRDYHEYYRHSRSMLVFLWFELKFQCPNFDLLYKKYVLVFYTIRVCLSFMLFPWYSCPRRESQRIYRGPALLPPAADPTEISRLAHTPAQISWKWKNCGARLLPTSPLEPLYRSLKSKEILQARPPPTSSRPN